MSATATVAGAAVAGLVDDAHIDDYPEDLYHYDAIAKGVEGFDAVGEAEIEHFHQHGFLVINHAFNPQEVKGAIDGLVHLLSGAVPEFTGVMYEQKAQGIAVEEMPAEQRQDYVRKFMWFTPHDERLAAMAHHPRLIDVVTRHRWRDAPAFSRHGVAQATPHWPRKNPGTRITPILICR